MEIGILLQEHIDYRDLHKVLGESLLMYLCCHLPYNEGGIYTFPEQFR